MRVAAQLHQLRRGPLPADAVDQLVQHRPTAPGARLQERQGVPKRSLTCWLDLRVALQLLRPGGTAQARRSLPDGWEASHVDIGFLLGLEAEPGAQLITRKQVLT